jgi:hypothetical protein
MKRTKWLIYTVCVGLIPIVIRFFIYWFSNNITSIEYVFNETELITFGLILHLTNINELEDRIDLDRSWKTKKIGTSVILMVVLSVLLGIAYLADANPDGLKIDRVKIKLSAGALDLATLAICYFVYNRLNVNSNEPV